MSALPAIAAAAGPVVRTVAGNSINTGIWTLVGVVGTAVVTTIGLIAVAVIKQWGPWQVNESAAREKDFERLRADIKSQNDRIDKLQGTIEETDKRAASAEQHAMRSDAKLQTALTACEILLGLVEREMPNAPDIALVKRLLAQAAADDMGIGAGMRKIAMMQGTGQ